MYYQTRFSVKGMSKIKRLLEWNFPVFTVIVQCKLTDWLSNEPFKF
jgi:hypothetical protein